MRISEIMTPSFRALRDLTRKSQKSQKSIVELCRSNDSDFCREVVARGWLTEEQMAHAAERYRLGRSRSGRCIFWMIDEIGRVYDGHIGDAWASVMLKARDPELLREWHTEHCLLGAHLVGNEKIKELKNKTSVAVVESERSAVILSEVLPEYVWMAAVYPMNLNVGTLQALCGHRVVLFPPTDETGETYLAWLEVADQARRELHLDISVSSVLEEGATEEQKRRKIDLVEYLWK